MPVGSYFFSEMAVSLRLYKHTLCYAANRCRNWEYFVLFVFPFGVRCSNILAVIDLLLINKKKTLKTLEKEGEILLIM